MEHVRTDLEYSYEPADLFEMATSIQTTIGSIAADAGRLVLTIDAPKVPVDRVSLDTVTETVRAVLQARQLLVHRQFALLGPNVIHYRANGLRDIVLSAEAGKFELRGHPVDFLVTDATGKVVTDTRADRVTEHTAFVRQLAEKIPRSPTLRRMLQSYGEAVSDPSNELVHLYEIRDAAVRHFGDEKTAIKGLSLSAGDWSALGKLANQQPLKEGRHRGRQLSQSRHATKAELEKARNVARGIIDALAQLV